MAVYFNNPVMAQQRMADDQLPMQQEALRLQELAQLLQASQQNKQTDSQERQNRERVGAQRYQTDTYGEVARGQNEIGRRNAENDILKGINELSLNRDRLNQQAEQFRIQAGLSKEQMVNALEIAKVNAGRNPLRSQDQADILLNNAEVESENAAAQRAIAAVQSLAGQFQAQDEEALANEWLTSKTGAKEQVAKKAPTGFYIQQAINQLSQSNPEIGKMLVPSGTNAVQLTQRKPILFGQAAALATPLQSTNAPALTQEDVLANALRLMQGSLTNGASGGRTNRVRSGRFSINAVN
jgi:hypothetical protein